MIKNLSKSAGISLALVMALIAQTAMPLSALAKEKPVRNAGTIKVTEPGSSDEIPNNNPQLKTCSVVVEFYNYDNSEDVDANVTFTSKAPTKSTVISVIGDQSPTIVGDGDADGEGTNDHDGSFTYTLSFSGTPAKKGYHVDLDVKAAGTKGGAKQKVFWMPASCGSDEPEEDIEATAPAFADQTCDAKGTYTIPASEVFTYKVSVGLGVAVDVDAGTYEVTAPAKITITAYFGDTMWTEDGSPWVHMFNVPENCESTPGHGSVDTPSTPANPVVTAGTGSTVSELPTTGPGEMGVLIALLAAAATYGAAYFAQPKRLYE